MLFKFMQFKFPNEIGRILYGNSGQLRASLVNIGPKPMYIIDLSRSKSKNDKEEDLLSALEDLKNGVIISSFYGSGKQLLMLPPTIIVASNYVFDCDLLSKDRWSIYEIKGDKTLGEKNDLLRKEKGKIMTKKSEPIYQND